MLIEKFAADKWSYLEQWVEDCYYDMLCDIEDLMAYWSMG